MGWIDYFVIKRLSNKELRKIHGKCIERLSALNHSIEKIVDELYRKPVGLLTNDSALALIDELNRLKEEALLEVRFCHAIVQELEQRAKGKGEE